MFCVTKKHIARHNKVSSRPRCPPCRRVTQASRTKFRSSAMEQCHWDKTFFGHSHSCVESCKCAGGLSVHSCSTCLQLNSHESQWQRVVCAKPCPSQSCVPRPARTSLSRAFSFGRSAHEIGNSISSNVACVAVSSGQFRIPIVFAGSISLVVLSITNTV